MDKMLMSDLQLARLADNSIFQLPSIFSKNYTMKKVDILPFKNAEIETKC